MIARSLVSPADVVRLSERIDDGLQQNEAIKRRGVGYALRNLAARVPAVGELASSPHILATVKAVLGGGGAKARPVRSILFDKTPDANWHVGWHQDRAIAVAQRIDTPGFGPWSMKDGVPHVEPPIEILQNMVTLRLHLDNCGEGDGPLRVLPGSHRAGRLNVEQVKQRAAEHGAVTCTLAAGDAMLMRPLLLHASSPMKSGGDEAIEGPRRRRVIHIEYAACHLPGGLRWHEVNHSGADIPVCHPDQAGRNARSTVRVQALTES